MSPNRSHVILLALALALAPRIGNAARRDSKQTGRTQTRPTGYHTLQLAIVLGARNPGHLHQLLKTKDEPTELPSPEKLDRLLAQHIPSRQASVVCSVFGVGKDRMNHKDLAAEHDVSTGSIQRDTEQALRQLTKLSRPPELRPEAIREVLHVFLDPIAVNQMLARLRLTNGPDAELTLAAAEKRFRGDATKREHDSMMTLRRAIGFGFGTPASLGSHIDRAGWIAALQELADLSPNELRDAKISAALRVVPVAQIRRAIRQWLTVPQSRVLVARLGLNKTAPPRLTPVSEVATQLGMTDAQVRKHQNAALKALQEPLAPYLFLPFRHLFPESGKTLTNANHHATLYAALQRLTLSDNAAAKGSQ